MSEQKPLFSREDLADKSHKTASDKTGPVLNTATVEDISAHLDHIIKKQREKNLPQQDRTDINSNPTR